MNANRLLALYDRVADAPDAVPRLRRFILDLAVRGRLIEQDPDDEPASELLKRIAAEKARLVKSGEIRKRKTLPPIEEPPFNIPDNWSWRPIREITSDRGQKVPDATFTYIDVTAIDKENGIVVGPRILEHGKAPSRARKITRKDDVVYSCVRPYLLNVAVIEQDFDPCPIASTAFAILNGHGFVLPRYLWIVLRSPFMVATVEDNQRGQAYPAINDSDFALLPFPLPPLAEQQRIVAKVDELMALCDRLEALRAAREERRDRLTVAGLARLNAPGPDAAAFCADARFAVDNLPALTARADQVARFRRTILNLAVRGRLVEQDPADEPASKLLKRIVAEKARLVKAGKLNRRKLTYSAPPKALGFELPSGWAIVRFADVLIELQTGPFGASLHQNDYEYGGTPVINPASIKEGKIVPIKKMSVGDKTLERLSTFKLQTGDIVMGRRGELGRCAVVTEQEDGWLCGTGSLVLRLSVVHYAKFLAILISSPHVREYLVGSSVGATMQNLNQSILLGMSIGLPPIAEQQRIVAKVDELISLCDRLEASLAVVDDVCCRLLEALLREAVALNQDDLMSEALAKGIVSTG